MAVAAPCARRHDQPSSMIRFRNRSEYICVLSLLLSQYLLPFTASLVRGRSNTGILKHSCRKDLILSLPIALPRLSFWYICPSRCDSSTHLSHLSHHIPTLRLMLEVSLFLSFSSLARSLACAPEEDNITEMVHGRARAPPRQT